MNLIKGIKEIEVALNDDVDKFFGDCGVIYEIGPQDEYCVVKEFTPKTFPDFKIDESQRIVFDKDEYVRISLTYNSESIDFIKKDQLDKQFFLLYEDTDVNTCEPKLFISKEDLENYINRYC